VTIHVETLGEYPTTVGSIRISDPSKRDVFSLRGNGEFQLWNFKLKSGLNPTKIEKVGHGSYDVVVPSGALSFRLVANTTYVATVCSSRFVCDHIKFSFSE
jgi:hypothetical protein